MTDHSGFQITLFKYQALDVKLPIETGGSYDFVNVGAGAPIQICNGQSLRSKFLTTFSLQYW